MTTHTAVFSIYDSTSYRCLHPIAQRLSTSFDIDVKYLLLHELLPRVNLSSLSEEVVTTDLQPNLRAINYVRNPLVKITNTLEKPEPMGVNVLQQLVEDTFPIELTYEISRCLNELHPDLLFCAHDRLPFLKHLLKQCRKMGVPTVLIQHGVNRPALETPSDVPGTPPIITPTRDPFSGGLERFKRAVGFGHGAFLFCNPNVDYIYTFGDFFTQYLRELRSEYPCNGRGEVISAGLTEMNPTTHDPYETSVSNGLFLSQWQLEKEEWSESQQRAIVQRLRTIEEKNGFNINIRPHPKDSPEKIDRFFDEFHITNRPLNEDIRAHDLILTVDSTALLKGVIYGRVCGVIEPPEINVTFPPFTHNHLLSGQELDAASQAATRRDEQSQLEYLREFCFIPSVHRSGEDESPVEFVCEDVMSKVDSL